MNQSVELGLVSTSRVRASTWCYADLLPVNSHRRLLAMSTDRSKRTRRLACVGLGVFKEVLVVTGCCVPFPQKKSEKLYPFVVLNHWRDSIIFIRAGVGPIQEVVVLVLKCALAIAAVMAIYCLAIALMDHLSDWFHIGEVTGVK